MDGPFDRVPFVVQHQNDRTLFITQHRPELLNSQLRRAIPRQHYHTPVRASRLCAKRCGQRVADRPPQRLDDKIHVSRKAQVNGAEGRRSLIGKDDVSWANKRLQRFPEILLGQRALRLREAHCTMGNWRRFIMHMLFAQFHQRFDCLKHRNAGKPYVTDAGSVRLNFYRLGRG